MCKRVFVYLERHVAVGTVKMYKLQWEYYIFPGLKFTRAEKNTFLFLLDLKA